VAGWPKPVRYRNPPFTPVGLTRKPPKRPHGGPLPAGVPKPAPDRPNVPPGPWRNVAGHLSASGDRSGVPAKQNDRTHNPVGRLLVGVPVVRGMIRP